MKKKGSRDDLTWKLKRVLVLLDKISILLDEILWNLVNSGTPRVIHPRGDPRPLQATRLSITADADGTAVVTVDDLPSLRFPRVLAALLYTLALDREDSDANHIGDPLVPYKSYEEISSNMRKLLGKIRYTEGALKQGIYRLRKILASRSLDGLIQTDRQRRAYRFALRRIGPPLPESAQ